MTCPWCGAGDVEQIAPYGTLLMTAQWFCNACGSPFERVRHRGEPARGERDSGAGHGGEHSDPGHGGHDG